MTLIIMAAGIGSRFGGGIKQLQRVDDAGHIIMDYSIHDAIKAGFNHIVFIIRRDMENDFKEIIGNRISQICGEHGVDVSYVYQEITDMPGRTKPLGTGHAVLACKDVVNEPFAVINADDYYGKNAFESIYKHLNSSKSSEDMYCLAGFILKNTLSDNGSVTRGICRVDENEFLTDIAETKNILRTDNGTVESNGTVIDENSKVSMNMWGFPPEFFSLLESGYMKFRKQLEADDNKSEFLIPIYIGELLKSNQIKVKVLESKDRWFGMTYREDVPTVIEEFALLIEHGEYSSELFDDLKH